MPQLSAIIITRNEAANIGGCLDSVAFCDERIVVDCGSSDGTVDIAKAKGAARRVSRMARVRAAKEFCAVVGDR